MDEQLDFASLPHPPNALYRDFLAAGGAAAEFYVGPGWSLQILQASAERTLAHPRDRAALTAALVRQQEARGSAAAVAQARRLLDPRSAAIVTGQQAVLFGGPLLVLYKALAARRLARELEALRGASVVPVFWVASDDHDFAEIRVVDIIDASGAVRTLRYAPATEPPGLPAARIVLDETITALVDELRQALPTSPNRDDVVALLGESYRPGQTVASAFAAWMQRLLPDVVFLDPADAELKALMLPVMRRELEEASPTSRLAAEAGTRLEAAGYHQQVQVRGGGFLNLFVVEDGERRALGVQDGRVDVRGLDRRWTTAEALAELERRPADWSPGALLRPLAEDHLLPTAAYVGGPAEIAYHAQIGPAYAHFGIPRPALVPRPALTLIEPTQARALETEEVTLLDLLGDPNVLNARRANAAFPEVERAFTAAREAIASHMGTLENVLAEIDPTLRAAAEGARGRALHQLEGLQEKATRALKKRDETRTQRLQRTRDALFPGGEPQERRLGLVGLVARHGLGIVDELERRLDPWAHTHQVLYL
jgi:bacillithiol synthase